MTTKTTETNPTDLKNTSHPDLDPPNDLEDAENRRLDLVAEIQTISAQLGDRDRRSLAGERMSSAEYWEWRRRAISALHAKEAALRRLKAWIRSQKHAQRLKEAPELGLGGPNGLLKAAYELLRQLQAQNVTFLDEEKHLIETIEAYLAESPMADEA